jgi:hypothetical protein
MPPPLPRPGGPVGGGSGMVMGCGGGGIGAGFPLTSTKESSGHICMVMTMPGSTMSSQRSGRIMALRLWSMLKMVPLELVPGPVPDDEEVVAAPGGGGGPLDVEAGGTVGVVDVAGVTDVSSAVVDVLVVAVEELACG